MIARLRVWWLLRSTAGTHLGEGQLCDNPAPHDAHGVCPGRTYPRSER